MASTPTRIALGFVLAVVSVLIFHQGMWELLHRLALPGLGMPPPFPMDPTPPFGVPKIASLCFWGGLWGALFGAVYRGSRGNYWWAGLLLGCAAQLTGLFIVPLFKGLPVGGGWNIDNWTRGFLINGSWGLGVGLMFTVLLGMAASRRREYPVR